MMPIAFALLFFVVFTAPAAHAQNVDGYTFNATMRFFPDGVEDSRPNYYKVSVAGRNARINILGADSKIFPFMYFLTNDGGKTFWIVDENAKDAVLLSKETHHSLLTSVGKTVKGISQSVPEPTGVGETVDGIVTKRYRISLGYTTYTRQPDEITIKTIETCDFDLALLTVTMPRFNPVVSFLLIDHLANMTPATKGVVKALPDGLPLRMTIKSAVTIGKNVKHIERTLSCDAPVNAVRVAERL